MDISSRSHTSEEVRKDYGILPRSQIQVGESTFLKKGCGLVRPTISASHLLLIVRYFLEGLIRSPSGGQFGQLRLELIQSNPLNGSMDNGSIRLLVQVFASPISVLS